MELRGYSSFGFFALFITFMCGAQQAFAGPGVSASADLPESKLNLIETNLICALESDMPALQASAAQVIRDVKAHAPGYTFARSVIPLLRILKDENQDAGVRQMAALTLHELGSDRGDYAIEREAKYSDQPQLKRLCTWLTYARFDSLAVAKAMEVGPSQLITEKK